MILFYGRLDDPPLTEAITSARERALEHLVLDQRDADRSEIILEVESEKVSGRLHVGGQEVPLDRVTGVYARPLELPARWSSAVARLRAETFHEIFIEWLDLAPTRVVNRPSAMDSNSSKPFQAQLIARAGFEVPETLVTSDPDEARAFWRRHGRVIFKSISGVRSIVRELDTRSAERLDRLRMLPTQFQAYVPGVDLRAHVVGECVFTAEIRSGATDYRYASQSGDDAQLSPVDLPAAIHRRCLALAADLKLAFCGIDLRRTPAGEFICFEVNPMPGYSYYQSHTGLPISDALVDLLAGSNN